MSPIVGASRQAEAGPRGPLAEATNRAAGMLLRATPIQGPLAFDAAVVTGWLVGRLAGVPEIVAISVVVAAVGALRWPSGAAALAGLVLLFPDGGRHVAHGLGLLLAAGVGELFWSFRWKQPLGVDLIVVAVSGLLATTALALFATLGSADAPDAVRSSFRWVGLASGLLVLPIQLFLIGRGVRRPAMILGCGVVAALGLALLAHLAPSVVALSPLQHLLSSVESDRATGPFDSPNRLGSVAAMALVVALGAMFTTNHRARRTILPGLALVAFVAAATLLLSFSRGAMLGVGVAVSVMLALRSPRVGLAVGAGLLAVGLLLAPLLISARLGFDSGSRPGELAANDNERLAAWRAGVEMFSTAPLTGHGYGSFAWIAAEQGQSGSLQTAHNEVIGLLAETGLPGAGAFVVLFAVVLVRSLRLVEGATIALGATTVFVVASMFNIQSVYPQVTVVLWTCVAYGLATIGSNRRAEPEPG